RLEKVPRRKGETASRNTTKKGYTPKNPEAWSAQRPPSPKKKPHNRKPVWGEKIGWLRPTKGALSKPVKRSDQIHS
ncbi:hypothetical protein ACYSTU_26880, partial [Pseudomonas glycinis]